MNTGRKISGGKYHALRKQPVSARLKQAREVTLGQFRNKQIRVKGGVVKTVLMKADEALVAHKGKVQRAKIINVEQTPQNQFFARENRLMKGAIIETSLGKAKITNRPSQEGQINAILLGK